MEESNKLVFEAYRYQILPITKNIQLRIDDKDLTYDKLVKRKNRYFEEILKSDSIKFKRGNASIVHESEQIAKDKYKIRFGLQKKDLIEKSDFTKEQIERYPDFFVLIDNRPNQQIMLIQRNYKAFDKTETVSRILERNLNRYLRSFHLSVYVQPIYTESEFWQLAKQYEKQITKVIFEFIRPNMANISGGLADDLRSFQTDSNAHKGRLQLDAPNNGHLEMDDESKELNGIVNYSSQGGGEIYMKVQGLRKRIKTSEGIRSVEIDELSISNLDKDSFNYAIKKLNE